MILYLDTNVLVYSIAANDDLREPTQEAQADIYLTGDRRLKAYRGVRVADVLRDKPGPTQRTSG